jgi:GTP-binding protein HflX
LERTFRRRVLPQQVVSPELARHLAALSVELGRQIGVLISREGIIRRVILGDATHIELPDIGRLRGGGARFRGLRLVHTHLRGEPISQDDLNDLALLRLDLVAAIHVGSDGNPEAIELAHILPVTDNSSQQIDPFRRIEARDIFSLSFDFEEEIRALESEFSKTTGKRADETENERALILAITPGETALSEITELVRAAGVELLAREDSSASPWQPCVAEPMPLFLILI